MTFSALMRLLIYLFFFRQKLSNSIEGFIGIHQLIKLDSSMARRALLRQVRKVFLQLQRHGASLCHDLPSVMIKCSLYE